VEDDSYSCAEKGHLNDIWDQINYEILKNHPMYLTYFLLDYFYYQKAVFSMSKLTLYEVRSMKEHIVSSLLPEGVSIHSSGLSVELMKQKLLENMISN